MRAIVLVAAAAAAAASPIQSQPALVGAQFDVVSIKPHPEPPGPGSFRGIRTLPGGTFMMTAPIRSILPNAAPEPVYEVTGYPAWVGTEFYDIIAKPAPDSHPTRAEQREMMRNMLVERFKLAGHIEEAERTSFDLVVARSDRRLGPQLRKSSEPCGPRPPADADASTPRVPHPCSVRMGMGTIDATGIRLDNFVLMLRGFAGGPVTNRTGLDDAYDISLRFAMPRLSATGAASDDDAPQFVTALQEQLGLKLVPGKTTVKIFVVDHIERPTPD